MTTTSTTHTHPKVTTQKAGAWIRLRKQFSTSGSLKGGYMDAGVGILPQNRVNGFMRATEADDFYAVYSYATPIAWYAHGSWVVPQVKYSATTSRHQSIVRRATGL
jgi:hypothetical protein